MDTEVPGQIIVFAATDAAGNGLTYITTESLLVQPVAVTVSVR